MTTCKKRVLVTGITGLLGSQTYGFLKASGYDVHAIVRRDSDLPPDVRAMKGDLFDDGFLRSVVEAVKPTHLLNLAWCVTGDYAESSENDRFLHAGMTMLEAFADNGGTRAVYAGSYFEYGNCSGVCSERTPLHPESRYAKCKVRLLEAASEFSQSHGVSFAWGRLMQVFGRETSPGRLTSYIANELANGRDATVRHGQLVRDFIYSKDAAEAIVKLLDSDFRGPVLICGGKGVSLKEYAEAFSRIIGGRGRIVAKNEPTTSPEVVVGDPSVLQNLVGYTPRHTVSEALKELVDEGYLLNFTY